MGEFKMVLHVFKFKLETEVSPIDAFEMFKDKIKQQKAYKTIYINFEIQVILVIPNSNEARCFLNFIKHEFVIHMHSLL